MSNTRFEDFLIKQLHQAQSATINWEVELEEWKQHLEALYQTVEAYLKPYIDEGKIKLTYTMKTIEEQYIGEYEVRSAIISIGANDLKLIPIGMNIIGAKGRVDLIGPNGKILLVLVDRDSTAPKLSSRVSIKDEESSAEDALVESAEPVWKIASEPPHVIYFPLNEDSFFDAIMELSDE